MGKTCFFIAITMFKDKEGCLSPLRHKCPCWAGVHQPGNGKDDEIDLIFSPAFNAAHQKQKEQYTD